MAIIIRMKELLTESDPESEYPRNIMRTTGIYKVPNNFDYGALCDDRNDVEVIEESVPDDAVMGIRDMPAPKPVLKDEGELSDIILSNIHLLTCFNCGKALKDVPSRHRVGVEEAGVLCIDPGRINYPREPDEPAQAYFECMDCRGLENGH